MSHAAVRRLEWDGLVARTLEVPNGQFELTFRGRTAIRGMFPAVGPTAA